jgi:16S rRNA (uracil1498-N3)-methyltransferase
MKNIFLDTSCLRGGGVVVEGGYFHYLAHVRRLRRGSRVSAVIGGCRYDLAVSEVGAAAITFDILESRRAAGPGPCAIHVYQGLLKANKLDIAVAGLSELGVREFVLLETERAVRGSPVSPGRMERWGRLVREGAKVSGIERLMELRGPVPLSGIEGFPGVARRAAPREIGKGESVLVFCAGAGHRHVRDALDAMPAGETARYDLFFGPEGGFSDGEIGMLIGIGGVPVSMGDFVLRSETAAVVGAGFVRVYSGGGTESTCKGTEYTACP